jgi:hypothetical protein
MIATDFFQDALKQSSLMPLIVAGDFNTASHEDWGVDVSFGLIFQNFYIFLKFFRWPNIIAIEPLHGRVPSCYQRMASPIPFDNSMRIR